ncbi:hypothetical protein FQN50_008953 [Emmonsiellopsis sp. PD_5]|nr:hypothetical protein FQN50_008953 [Emmonsiellopsis sp. PD_5]
MVYPRKRKIPPSGSAEPSSGFKRRAPTVEDTPELLWDSCAVCLGRLVDNPRATCKPREDGDGCVQCKADSSHCVEIPNLFIAQAAAIQALARLVHTSSRDSLMRHRRQNELAKKYAEFHIDLQGYCYFMESSDSSESEAGGVSRAPNPSNGNGDGNDTGNRRDTPPMDGIVKKEPNTAYPTPGLDEIKPHISASTHTTAAVDSTPTVSPAAGNASNNSSRIAKPNSAPRGNREFASTVKNEDAVVAKVESPVMQTASTHTPMGGIPHAHMSGELLTVLGSINRNLSRVADALERRTAANIKKDESQPDVFPD